MDLIDIIVMCLQATSQFYEYHSEVLAKLVRNVHQHFDQFFLILAYSTLCLILFIVNRIKRFRKKLIHFKNSGINIPKK